MNCKRVSPFKECELQNEEVHPNKQKKLSPNQDDSYTFQSSQNTNALEEEVEQKNQNDQLQKQEQEQEGKSLLSPNSENLQEKQEATTDKDLPLEEEGEQKINQDEVKEQQQELIEQEKTEDEQKEKENEKNGKSLPSYNSENEQKKQETIDQIEYLNEEQKINQGEKESEKESENQEDQVQVQEQELKQEKYILILDTETTRIPENGDLNDKSLRLLELAYIIQNAQGEEIKRYENLVKPEGFVIPELKKGQEEINDITQKLVEDKGVPIGEVLEQFGKDLKLVNKVVAHNVNFDKIILLDEIFRTNNRDIYYELQDKEIVCTMKLMQAKLQLLDFPINNYKLPTIYEKIFGKKINTNEYHRSMHDALICSECYFKLIRDDFIPIEEDPEKYIVDFGKHKGKTIQQMIQNHAGYIKYFESKGNLTGGAKNFIDLVKKYKQKNCDGKLTGRAKNFIDIVKKYKQKNCDEDEDEDEYQREAEDQDRCYTMDDFINQKQEELEYQQEMIDLYYTFESPEFGLGDWLQII